MHSLARCSRITTPPCPTPATSRRSEPTLEQLTFLSGDPRAKTSASRDFELDWTASAVNSPLNFFAYLTEHGPAGWSGRTSPVSLARTVDGRLEPSSGRWKNSGMGGPTGSWTLSTSEFHSAADVCSLSDVLEMSDVPQRYYLSAQACRGILRRAAKRGKSLPRSLHDALLAAASEQTSIATAG